MVAASGTQLRETKIVDTDPLSDVSAVARHSTQSRTPETAGLFSYFTEPRIRLSDEIYYKVDSVRV